MTFFHLIDGTLDPGSGFFPVIDPATGASFADCPDAGAVELDRAVAAARRAQPDWNALGFAARREALTKLADALLANIDRLAPLLTAEQGKPAARAVDEIKRAASDLRAIPTIEIASSVLRESEADLVELHYRPIGVVGAITPWNAPIILAGQKIAQALYAGNTMVLKPSPYTPLTTLLIGEIAADLLPAGVLNIIAGGNAFGAMLTGHPGIDKISFTGSGPTGRKVMAAAAGSLKRITLELGGNDAAILLDDADLARAIPAVFAAGFINSGQICMAVKRVYAHDSIYDTVVAGLTELARQVVLGPGSEAGVTMGPVQNRAQFERVSELIEDARRQPGAIIVEPQTSLPAQGYFIAPTIVAGLSDGTRIVDEEPFGPVLPVIRFKDEEDALRRANASEFGLSGSVWSRDADRARRLAMRLEVGTAWVNRHGGSDPLLPFGGVKSSGLGREQGLVGLLSYMEPFLIHTAR